MPLFGSEIVGLRDSVVETPESLSGGFVPEQFSTCVSFYSPLQSMIENDDDFDILRNRKYHCADVFISERSTARSAQGSGGGGGGSSWWFMGGTLLGGYYEVCKKLEELVPGLNTEVECIQAALSSSKSCLRDHMLFRAASRNSSFVRISFEKKNEIGESVLVEGKDRERGGIVVGSVIAELYENVCPKTVNNFLELIPRYAESVVHRIVKDTWVQMGDIVEGKGDSGETASGEPLLDESFAVEHSGKYMMGMAGGSRGMRHKATSQFYISLRPLPHMDMKRVVFGRVVEGSCVIDHLNQVETSVYERPVCSPCIKGIEVITRPSE